jgi:hypothetical protein
MAVACKLLSDEAGVFGSSVPSYVDGAFLLNINRHHNKLGPIPSAAVQLHPSTQPEADICIQYCRKSNQSRCEPSKTSVAMPHNFPELMGGPRVERHQKPLHMHPFTYVLIRCSLLSFPPSSVPEIWTWHSHFRCRLHGDNTTDRSRCDFSRNSSGLETALRVNRSS